MKLILLGLCFTVSMGYSQEDSTQILAIRATIDQLFEGMRSGDSSLVRSTFHDDVDMMSSYSRNGKSMLHEGNPEDFLDAVGKPHDQIWDERISNVVIQQDAGLAQAWMDYSFYLGDTFSHQGTNAIQLVYLEDRWQIIHLIDTRKQ